jgi:hypothetical protein
MIFDFVNLQVSGMIVSAEGVGFEPTDHGWDHDQRFSRLAVVVSLNSSFARDGCPWTTRRPRRTVGGR